MPPTRWAVPDLGAGGRVRASPHLGQRRGVPRPDPHPDSLRSQFFMFGESCSAYGGEGKRYSARDELDYFVAHPATKSSAAGASSGRAWTAMRPLAVSRWAGGSPGRTGAGTALRLMSTAWDGSWVAAEREGRRPITRSARSSSAGAISPGATAQNSYSCRVEGRYRCDDLDCSRPRAACLTSGEEKRKVARSSR